MCYNDAWFHLLLALIFMVIVAIQHGDAVAEAAAVNNNEASYQTEDEYDSTSSFTHQGESTGTNDNDELNVMLHKAAEQERHAMERAERKRMEREREFERELERMNEEQRKKALRQKRADARIVRRVLRAAKRERHYAVLGLRNWEINIGPLTFFRVSSRHVKEAYRTLAKAVHPDKNRDARAEEAFVLLETSASLLLDEEARKEYDDRVRRDACARRRERRQRARDSVDLAYRSCSVVVMVLSKFVKPFATPIVVLGALIV